MPAAYFKNHKGCGLYEKSKADVILGGEDTMDIMSVIGNTPLIELKNLNINPEVRIFGKFEGFNYD